MQPQPFRQILAQIVKEDPRYAAESYLFLRKGLEYAVKLHSKPDRGPGRHVTGRELLEGLRQCALREFGPMAFTVLATWGIRRTEDFGEVVFNLVDRGLLGKTEQDSRDDFAGGYDFKQAFVTPFLPRKANAKPRRGARRPPAQPQEPI